jgi:hypothetical protein
MVNIPRTWWIITCLILATVCYYLPWYTHDTAGFTMNGFDLAEWTSLHPAVRSESPPMLTSFLLRAPQVVLAVALALAANQLDDERWRWILRAGAVLLALRMIPPKEFFDGATDDPNYRQMAWLTGAGLLLVMIAIPLYRVPKRWQAWSLAGMLLFGVIVSWMGLSRASTLLDNFEIDVQVGFGILGLSVLSVLTALIALWPQIRTLRMFRQRQTAPQIT